MAETTIVQRKNTGRRKIEIKKIENKNNLQVTFSKRRRGLVKKAAELSLLSGADVAVIVESPAGKVYASGGRAPINSIIDRYLVRTPSSSSNNAVANQIHEQQHHVAVVGQYEDEKKFVEIMKKIEVEKAKEKSLMQNKSDNAKGFWWEQPIDNLELDELEEYIAAMEGLMKNVMTKAEEMASSAAANNNADASSILIPNVTLDCFGGLPIRHYESDNKVNVDTIDQLLILENLNPKTKSEQLLILENPSPETNSDQPLMLENPTLKTNSQDAEFEYLY